MVISLGIGYNLGELGLWGGHILVSQSILGRLRERGSPLERLLILQYSFLLFVFCVFSCTWDPNRLFLSSDSSSSHVSRKPHHPTHPSSPLCQNSYQPPGSSLLHLFTMLRYSVFP